MASVKRVTVVVTRPLGQSAGLLALTPPKNSIESMIATDPVDCAIEACCAGERVF